MRLDFDVIGVAVSIDVLIWLLPSYMETMDATGLMPAASVLASFGNCKVSSDSFLHGLLGSGYSFLLRM